MTSDAKTSTVRTMRWWDVEAVHEIETRVFPQSAWSTELFWSELAGVPDTRWYLVAEDRGAIVGYAGLMAVPPDADVQTIAVAASSQRRGVGQLLLSELLGEAERRGATRIFLEVAADNAPAQQLYARNGFEVSSRRRNYYSPGRDAVVMQRSLPCGTPE